MGTDVTALAVLGDKTWLADGFVVTEPDVTVGFGWILIFRLRIEWTLACLIDEPRVTVGAVNTTDVGDDKEVPVDEVRIEPGNGETSEGRTNCSETESPSTCGMKIKV